MLSKRCPACNGEPIELTCYEATSDATVDARCGRCGKWYVAGRLRRLKSRLAARRAKDEFVRGLTND